MNNSISQGCIVATFFKSLLTFHGHCYPKERVNSLRQMIEIGSNIGGMLAFEVGVILLQGSYVEQDIDKGIELIQIAESSGYIIPESIKDGVYHSEVITFYDRIINRQCYKVDYPSNPIYECLITRNPIYQTIVGLNFIFNNGDFEIAKSWIELAIEQDFLPAEFVYAFLLNGQESCDHLLKAARGGNIQSQVLIGLYYIYGVYLDTDIENGLNWLNTASYQGYLLAYEIKESIDNLKNSGFIINLDNSIDFFVTMLKRYVSQQNNWFTHILLKEISQIIINYSNEL